MSPLSKMKKMAWKWSVFSTISENANHTLPHLYLPAKTCLAKACAHLLLPHCLYGAGRADSAKSALCCSSWHAVHTAAPLSSWPYASACRNAACHLPPRKTAACLKRNRRCLPACSWKLLAGWQLAFLLPACLPCRLCERDDMFLLYICIYEREDEILRESERKRGEVENHEYGVGKFIILITMERRILLYVYEEGEERKEWSVKWARRKYNTRQMSVRGNIFRRERGRRENTNEGRKKWREGSLSSEEMEKNVCLYNMTLLPTEERPECPMQWLYEWEENFLLLERSTYKPMSVIY